MWHVSGGPTFSQWWGECSHFKSRSKTAVQEAMYSIQKVGHDHDGFEIFRVKTDINNSNGPNVLNQPTSNST